MRPRGRVIVSSYDLQRHTLISCDLLQQGGATHSLPLQVCDREIQTLEDLMGAEAAHEVSIARLQELGGGQPGALNAQSSPPQPSAGMGGGVFAREKLSKAEAGATRWDSNVTGARLSNSSRSLEPNPARAAPCARDSPYE